MYFVMSIHTALNATRMFLPIPARSAVKLLELIPRFVHQNFYSEKFNLFLVFLSRISPTRINIGMKLVSFVTSVVSHWQINNLGPNLKRSTVETVTIHNLLPDVMDVVKFSVLVSLFFFLLIFSKVYQPIIYISRHVFHLTYFLT